MKKIVLKILACYRILLSRNPWVLLWNRGSNVVVSKDNFHEELDWQITFMNVSSDEGIDIIFDVADSLENDEIEQFYGDISSN